MTESLETTNITDSHILLVEDSDTQAMRMRLYLEASGWTVSRAASGQEARQLLFGMFIADKSDTLVEKSATGGMSFDIVMLDYNLPDVFGDVLCREIRENDETRQMPVMMLTASEREETELQTLQSGADDFVSKSVPIEVVLTRLSSLLQKARARTELSQQYEREKRVAQVLQESLLSTPPADAFPGLKFGMVYVSAWDEARIGGDFYDMRTLDDGRIALVVGDVAGKGLAAATFTAEVKYALRAFLHESPEPGQAMERLNNFLCDSADKNTWLSTACVAVALALCDPKTGAVEIASAGSEPPMVVSKDDAGVVNATEIVSKHGPLLGIMSGIPYETHKLQLGINDILVLLTDGITEARQRGGPMLGYEAMAEVARERYVSSNGAIDPIVDGLLSEARRISGGQLLDDVCLLAVQRS